MTRIEALEAVAIAAANAHAALDRAYDDPAIDRLLETLIDLDAAEPDTRDAQLDEAREVIRCDGRVLKSLKPQTLIFFKERGEGLEKCSMMCYLNNREIRPAVRAAGEGK